MINLILFTSGGYGGTAEDWGEGIWDGVGSYHSQSNTDIMISSVLFITILLLAVDDNKYALWIGEVKSVFKESYILITLVIFLQPHTLHLLTHMRHPQDNSFL